MNNELYHYGIKGMKWGVRRFNRDKNNDLYIKKGTTVKRVTSDPNDPTYDNKKYVSVNQRDTNKWDTHLGKLYANKYDTMTYVQPYTTTKDLKIASSTKQGELYVNMLLNTTFKNRSIKDTEYANKALGLKPSSDMSENISRNIAAQTKTGKEFVKKLQEMKYDAIFDTHGTNVSKNPLIILNPDENLKKTEPATYTKITKKILKDVYGVKV